VSSSRERERERLTQSICCVSSVAHHRQCNLLLSSTTTDIPTAGVTTTTGSQLHTSVFDQNRRCTHTHTRARALPHLDIARARTCARTRRNFRFQIPTRSFIHFQTRLLLANGRSGISALLISTPVNVEECLYLFHYSLSRRVCFEIRGDPEKEEDDAG